MPIVPENKAGFICFVCILCVSLFLFFNNKHKIIFKNYLRPLRPKYPPLILYLLP